MALVLCSEYVLSYAVGSFTADAMLTRGSVAFLYLKGFTQISIVCMALFTSFFIRVALASL